MRVSWNGKVMSRTYHHVELPRWVCDVRVASESANGYWNYGRLFKPQQMKSNDERLQSLNTLSLMPGLMNGNMGCGAF